MDLPPAVGADGVAVEHPTEHDHDIGRLLAGAKDVGQPPHLADLGLEPGERGEIVGRQFAEAHEVLGEHLTDRRVFQSILGIEVRHRLPRMMAGAELRP
jgi:hypothetical protein